MTTDFNRREPDTSSSDDGSMFAAKPIWEQRGKKRRGGFGGGRKASTDAPAPAPEPSAPETRTFAPPEAAPEAARAQPDLTLDRPMSSTATPSTFAAGETTGDEPMATPIRASTTTRAKPKSGASPAIIAGGVAALALVAAGGWYMARPHGGVPTLAPGEATTTEVAAAPILPPAAQPSEVSTASNTLQAAHAPAATPAPTRPERMASAARVRPAARAAAPSAATSGTNASAVLPDGPQPYSALNPGAAPTQVTPAAPPPTEAPAAIPTTPPVESPQAAPPTSEAPAPTPPS